MVAHFIFALQTAVISRMASVLGDIICSLKNFLAQGFRSLPVILAGTTLLLGATQANFNFLFFFVGLFILAPTAALVINGLTELAFVNIPYINQIPQNLWLVPGAGGAQCSLLSMPLSGQSSIPMNAVPTYWMTIMAFFFTYLFQNALNLYEYQANSKAPANAVSARKSQAAMSMFIVVVLAILTTIMRYATSCETGLGMVIAWAVGIGIGSGWYSFMRACGLGRLDDLFGINNRILPLQSYEESDPTVCVPTA
jgi:hypothetical protein